MKTEWIKASLTYGKAFLKWCVLAAIVGFVGGTVGSLFHECIEKATAFRNLHPWILFLLPAGGVLIAGMYALSRKRGRIDTNRVLEAVSTEEKVPFVMAPLIFVSTVITHLLGGSAGREGAALQLGGSLGYRLGRVFRLQKADMHFVVMAGMSAVFSALFGTPLAAAFFAIEVASVGTMQYGALLPSVLAALTAFGVAGWFGIAPVRFMITAFPSLSPVLIGRVAVLALLCALISILFCASMKKCECYMERFLPGPYLRTIVGGIILILLTLAVGNYDYNGAGMEVIARAMGGQAEPVAFLLKILFTAITIAAGFKGGEIVPAFFIGSTFGCVVGPLLGLDAGLAAAIGFVALFCGVVNCPVASLLLALEAFGAEGASVFAVVCAVSHLMSGKSGLYKSQRQPFGKLEEIRPDIASK